MKFTNFSEQNSILHTFVNELRDVDIQKDPLRFRHNLERIGQIMAYEISKTMNYAIGEVQTPLALMSMPKLDEQIVLGTIFRAGLPLHNGFLSYFDRAENAFVSAYRKYTDRLKFDIHIEYISSPDLTGKTLILVDPMLATGLSLELAYRAMITKGQPSVTHLVSVIASQAGVDYIKNNLPFENINLWCGVVDPDLNEHSYIVPGLGDAGDLSFGTKL